MTEPSPKEEIFFAALEKGTAEERAAFLDEACAGDEGMRHQVDRLLTAHSRIDGFLERPVREAEELIPLVSPDTSRAGAAFDGGAAPSGRQETGEPLDFLGPSHRPGSLGRLGRYEVLEVVGKGAMGVVLRAFDEKLHRVVAIKVLAPALATTGAARQRFIREAQAAAAVTHDSVIAIYAVEDQGSVPYLVMQFIEGLTLQEKLERNGPLPLKEVLRIGLQIAAGLAAAHAQGLVHRDVKPANILLENGIERVKITDFGLARAVDDASLTQSGLIAGTPAFMSPEQANGEHVDHRSDLFSLGSVLYALCAGHAPFRAGTTVAVLKRVCDETPRPIREVNAAVPEWLEAIVARLHAKSAAGRYQTAAEVADLLGRHLAGVQQPGMGPSEPRARRGGAGRPAGEAAPSSRRLAAAVALLALGGVAASWIISRSFEAQAPAGVRLTTASGELPGPVNEPWRPRPPSTPEELARLSSPLDALKRDVTRLSQDAPPELLALLGKSPYFDMPGIWSCHWMAQTRDGRLLAVPHGCNIHLFEARTGRRLRTLTGHTSRAYRPDFSPDGALVASAEDSSIVRVWDVATGREELTLKGHEHPVWCVTFDSRGQRLVSADNGGTVKVWDAEGHLANSFRGHDAAVNQLAFSPDGKRLATASTDGSCKIWDGDDWHEVRSLSGDDNTFEALAWSRDGKLLSAGDDTTVVVWNADNYEVLHTLKTPGKGLLAFSPDGHTLWTARHHCVDGERHAFTRWDVATGARQATRELPTRGGTWVYLQLSPDGRTVFLAQHEQKDPQLQAYDAETGREQFPRPGHQGAVWSAAFSPDGRTLASGGADRTVRLWDLAGWRPEEPVPPLRVLEGAANEVGSVAFSPNGKLLACGSLDGLLHLRDPASGREVEVLTGHSRARSDVTFSPDGRTVAAGGDDGTVNRWDALTGQPKEPWRWHIGAVRTVAYSPDGRWLAAGGKDAAVQLLDATTGRRRHAFLGAAPLTSLAFSPDGQTLAAVSEAPESPPRLWDVETFQERALTGHAGHIFGISYHPDGSRVATASSDGNVRLRDATPAAREARTFDLSSGGEAYCAAFSPEGRYLAVGLQSGEIAIVRVTP